MTDAITNLAPQQAVGETPAEAGKQAGSGGPSFTKALTEALGDSKQTESKPAAGQSDPEGTDAQSALSELAGAVQVAMATPVQTNAAAVVADVPRDWAVSSVTDAKANASGSVDHPYAAVSETPSAVAIADPVPVVPVAGTTNVVSSVAQPAASQQADTTGGVTAQITEVPVVDGSTGATIASGVSEKPTASDVPREAPNVTAQVTAADAQLGAESEQSPISEGQSTAGVVGQARRTEVSSDAGAADDPKPAASDKPEATQNTGGRPSVAAQNQTPVQATPVEWRFDASSQAARVAPAEAATATVIQSVAGSGAKPAGKDANTAADQGLPNPQAAVPMGQQFATRLDNAARPETAEGSVDGLHTRVIDQVVREVSLHRMDGRSDIVVKLNPPDLGTLRLQISQDTSGMSTHIQAGSPQVRGLLEAHMPLLMDSLSKAGVRMDSVSVSVGTSFNAFAQNAHQQDAQRNANQMRQQYVPIRETVGVQAMAASQTGWTSAREIGHSWLA